MYDPKLARFLQEDTYLGDPNDPLSLNLYTYAFNNPISYYDPSGHISVNVNGILVNMDEKSAYSRALVSFMFEKTNNEDRSKNLTEHEYIEWYNGRLSAMELYDYFEMAEGHYFDDREGGLQTFRKLAGINYNGFNNFSSESIYNSTFKMNMPGFLLSNDIILSDPELAYGIYQVWNEQGVLNVHQHDYVKMIASQNKYYKEIQQEESEYLNYVMSEVVWGSLQAVGGVAETAAGIGILATTPVDGPVGIGVGGYFTINGLSTTTGGISRIANAGNGKGETWNFVRNGCHAMTPYPAAFKGFSICKEKGISQCPTMILPIIIGFRLLYMERYWMQIIQRFCLATWT
jgi:hypothetical protein